MRDASYDVVVVGGGPAGAAAARTAAACKLRTLLIDKRTFPREKLCGGLVTPRSVGLLDKIFPDEWDPSILNSSAMITFAARGNPLATVPSPTFYFCMRREFDAHLVSLAQAAGVDVRYGSAPSSINFEENTVQMPSGECIHYSVLIGADGVNSQIAKALFGRSFDQNTIGFGLEVEVPREDLPQQDNVIEVDFSAAEWGYGWVFPKKTTYTVGVGGIHRLNPDMKEKLRSYLELKNLDPNAFRVKGHYIPFGDYRHEPGRGNVMLCGDAAGVVDPITGEGIGYALETGSLAAHAAAEALSARKADNAYAFYKKRYRTAVSGVAAAKRWRYLIFPSSIRPAFEWAFRDAGTLQRGYLDILAGRLQYSDLYGLFWRQVARACKKLARHIVPKRQTG
jgi:geranylgeranyl reductase family protein